MWIATVYLNTASCTGTDGSLTLIIRSNLPTLLLNTPIEVHRVIVPSTIAHIAFSIFAQPTELKNDDPSADSSLPFRGGLSSYLSLLRHLVTK